MKNYFLIVLLLLAFNVNALTGTMMMPEMFFSIDTVASDHKNGSHEHHKVGMDESSDHTKMAKKINSDCVDDLGCNVCIAHCTSALISIETVDFNIQNPTGFTLNLISSEATSNYFRLLRPPKFS